MTDMFGDLEGVEIYIDDILIHAPDKKTLRERLRKVLKVCKENNLKLNWRKCLLEAAQVKYTGLLFDQEGIKIDKDRLRAISKIPEPTCKHDLQRFLGIVTYIGKFIPNMADKTSLLRDLKKDSAFVFTANHVKQFEKLKQVLIEAPVLRYFDVNKQVTISCDASRQGLGFVLMQDEHPIAYGSRSLSDSEKNYSQIEL
jgi:hypothetical protein